MGVSHVLDQRVKEKGEKTFFFKLRINTGEREKSLKLQIEKKVILFQSDLVQKFVSWVGREAVDSLGSVHLFKRI